MKLFRTLSEMDEADFRRWARTHYRAYEPILGTWHPVVQRECVKINEEAHPFDVLPMPEEK